MKDFKVYIATVHWNSDAWVETQVSKIREYIGQDVTIFAFMDGVSPKLINCVDHCFFNPDLSHPQKLDLLAKEIAQIANPKDVLIFIDGDAFPVADVRPIIGDLGDYRLIAVRRDENFGDKQPHPSFCATTVGFWQTIEGSWLPGPEWIRDDGKLGTDVGGKLYGLLENASITWKPLKRTNFSDLHPLFFGIYANCIYHHGAGFRNKLCRRDARLGIDGYSAFFINLIDKCQGKRYMRPLRRLLRRHIQWYMTKRNERINDFVMAKIRIDADFAYSLKLIKT